MRIRTGLCLLAGCCAALTACTAAPSNRPDATVTTPTVGRPPAPASAEAALSSEAFTPYAALGLSDNDGLAPGESGLAFAGACMTAEGYPGAAAAGQADFVNIGHGGSGAAFISLGQGLNFAFPSGGWGYLGAADAQQYGFLNPPGSLSAQGFPAILPSSAGLSPAAQAAASKCATILQDLVNPLEAGPLAVIHTLSNYIYIDMANDPAVKAANRAWSACMAKNGYSFGQPWDVGQQEQQAMYAGDQRITPSTPVSAAANRAQIAVAVTDAGCTQSSDLAGIYFAVQASYEQQLVTANQQALAAMVSAYRAAYNKELAKLPALLRTAKAQPFPQAGPPARRGRHAR
jgi:hypothetical protein